MQPRLFVPAAIGFLTLAVCLGQASAAEPPDWSPRPDEQQLPRTMRSAMDELPQLTVGQADADLIGHDQRALQAALDYVAGLGGGTVTIGPEVYQMRDSLHLRSHVCVRGVPGKTILRKNPSSSSPLALDGDFGEEQITVAQCAGFEVGDGVAIWDDDAGGFHTTVARILGRRGNTLAISKPLMADCMVRNGATAATVFPVVSGYDLEGARVENLTIDGAKDDNVSLNGCRGAGIFLYRGFGVVIQNCTVRNYDGDGISFQQSNDVQVLGCVSENNAALGIHPGSGSQRPLVRDCRARNNGTDGLFLCWRVRHGLFENNVLEGNGRFGISIGHKDSDNLLKRNLVRQNADSGVCFRNETLGMAAHRNVLEENVIEDNGEQGIRIRGETNELVLRNNVIRDTRAEDQRRQKVGILVEPDVGPLTLENNQIDAATPVDDRRHP